MLSILPGHIVSTVFCFVSSVLIAYQVIRHPNKLRLSILGYSIFTLPASIVNTLTLEDIISQRVNSLVYLVSTLLMISTHFFTVLDVGNRLRIEGASWKHPLVIIAVGFCCCSGILLIAQIIILAANISGTEEFPLKGTFIAGVVCAIIGDSSVFTYTFMPLLYWRDKRVNEGHSRTTAIGIWFFLIQHTWYLLYGALYVWFFVMNSWAYFNTMLALDYVLRFIENLLYTWPPPASAIDYFSSKLPSTSINLSTRKSSDNVMSSERYNKEESVQYNLDKGFSTLDAATRVPTENSGQSNYGSKVTIVIK